MSEEKRFNCDSFWERLPDNVTLHIFSFLEATSLFQVGLVCKAWLRIAYDELLWKDLFYRHWGISRSIPMAPGKWSWVQEYKRLFFHAPSVNSQVLGEHNDEVLHVSFSHNGKMLATCSKDSCVMIWNTDFPMTLKYKSDMGQFSWEYTLASQFNNSDTLLLVSSGPKLSLGSSGELALFTLEGGFKLKHVIPNEPYGMAGGWVDDHSFLSCQQQSGSNGVYCVIYLNEVHVNGYEEDGPVYSLVTERLFAFRNINYYAISTGIVANCHNVSDTKNIGSDKPLSAEITVNAEHERTGQTNQNTPTAIHSDEEIHQTVKRSKNQCDSPEVLHQDCSELYNNSVDTTNESMTETSRYNEDDFQLSQQVLQMDLTPSRAVWGKTVDCSYQNDCSNISDSRSCNNGSMERTVPDNREKRGSGTNNNLETLTSDRLSEVRESNDCQQTGANQREQDKFLVFATETKANLPHLVGLKKLPSGSTKRNNSPVVNEDVRDGIDHVIEMHGHIIGMCLSSDQRFLYVNCRPWPEGYEIADPLDPPQVKEGIEIFVIDLLTLEKSKTRLRGHVGYSKNDGFLLDLDVSDDYIASGAEDLHGYLWDRHYGVCVQKFPHDDVVSSVAFNLMDPEILVTASDDYSVKIWWSLNRQKRNTKS